MYYNGNPVEGLFYNGVAVQNAWYNGVQVWPDDALLSYRVYIEWDPVKDENICIDGMWWNGEPMTTDMFEQTPGGTSLDASVNINGSWVSLTTTEVEKMISGDTDSLQKYCRGITFRLKKELGFNSFSWRSDQYYAPTGTLVVEVDEIWDEHSNLWTKTVTQNPNTVYSITRS